MTLPLTPSLPYDAPLTFQLTPSLPKQRHMIYGCSLNKLHQIIRIPPGILDNKTTNVVFFRWYVLLSSF